MQSSYCIHWLNQHIVCWPTSRKPFINADFIIPNLFLMKGKNCTLKEPSSQLPGKFSAQNSLLIMAMSEHIIHCCIRLILTVECILSDLLTSAFSHKRHIIHKSYNMMNCIMTVNHHRKLLHFIWGWKPNFPLESLHKCLTVRQIMLFNIHQHADGIFLKSKHKCLQFIVLPQ